MKFLPASVVALIKQKAKSQTIATSVAAPIVAAGAKSQYPAWQVAGVATIAGYMASYGAARIAKGDTPIAPTPLTLSGVFSANLMAVKALRMAK